MQGPYPWMIMLLCQLLDVKNTDFLLFRFMILIIPNLLLVRIIYNNIDSNTHTCMLFTLIFTNLFPIKKCWKDTLLIHTLMCNKILTWIFLAGHTHILCQYLCIFFGPLPPQHPPAGFNWGFSMFCSSIIYIYVSLSVGSDETGAWMPNT